MTTYLKSVLSLLLLLTIIVSSLDAQYSDIKTRDITMLFKNNKELWVKKYIGTLDKTHPISLGMATNGKEWRGILRYEQSGIQFTVEGKKDKDLISFSELDSEGRASGHLMLSDSEDGLMGSWKSLDGSRSHDIAFVEYPTSKNPTLCPDSFTEYYSGKIVDTPSQLTIIRELGEFVKAELIYGKEVIELNPSCLNETCIVFSDTLDVEELPYTVLRFKYSDNSLGLVATGKKGDKGLATLELDGKLAYQCQNYLDYKQIKSILYPKTGSKFDSYIEEMVDAYMKTSKVQVAEDNIPDERLIKHFGAWIDIHYYDAHLISGMLYYSLDGGEDMSQTFTYHIKDEKVVEIKDVIDIDKLSKEIIPSYLAKEREEKQNFQDQAVQDWYNKQSYDLITLSEGGLKFSTAYNTLIGSQSFTIPYSEIKDEMKKSYRKRLMK